MRGEYRFVEDGDALCLRHEVRAAALRHPADEANDVLLCCAVIPGWEQVCLPHAIAEPTAMPTKSALATNSGKRLHQRNDEACCISFSSAFKQQRRCALEA